MSTTVKSGPLGHFQENLGKLLRTGVDSADLEDGLTVIGGHLIGLPPEVCDTFNWVGENLIAAAIRPGDGAVAYASTLGERRVGLFLEEGGSLLVERKPFTGGDYVIGLHFPEPMGQAACFIRRGTRWCAQFGQWSVPTMFESALNDEAPYFSVKQFLFWADDRGLGDRHIAMPEHGRSDVVVVHRWDCQTAKITTETFSLSDSLETFARVGDRILAIHGSYSRQSVTELGGKKWRDWRDNGRIHEPIRLDNSGRIYYRKSSPDLHPRTWVVHETGTDNWTDWSYCPDWIFNETFVTLPSITDSVGRYYTTSVVGKKLKENAVLEGAWAISSASLDTRGGQVSGIQLDHLLALVSHREAYSDQSKGSLWLVDPQTGHFIAHREIGLVQAVARLGAGVAVASRDSLGRPELIWLVPKAGQTLEDLSNPTCLTHHRLFGDFGRLTTVDGGRAMGWHCVGRTFYRTLYDPNV